MELFKKIRIIPIIIAVLIFSYINKKAKSNQIETQESNIIEPTKEVEEQYMKENHIIKIGDRYQWYDVKESREVKPITDALERNCKNDFCKIENYFNYVKKIPYEAGRSNRDRNPIDIIMEGKGDCDERSYLLASMMISNHYESIIIYTKDHAFIGLNIPNYDTEEPRSYFLYKNKKFYYAETTDKNAVIGAYNGIDPKELIHVYSVNEKKEIPLDQLNVQIYI